LILSGYFIYCNIKDKTYKLLNSLAVLAIAGIFAIGANATNLLATAEYATAPGENELSFNPDGSKVLFKRDD
jgi:hypothetical protein